MQNMKDTSMEYTKAALAVIAMSRGLVVLDENIQELESALEKMNITVVVPTAGMSDQKIKKQLLAHRIFITKNTKDFVDDASAYSYGIISLDKLKYIDKTKDETNETARKISQTIVKLQLWSKKHGFLVTLSDKGTATFKNLLD